MGGVVVVVDGVVVSFFVCLFVVSHLAKIFEILLERGIITKDRRKAESEKR